MRRTERLWTEYPNATYQPNAPNGRAPLWEGPLGLVTIYGHVTRYGQSRNRLEESQTRRKHRRSGHLPACRWSHGSHLHFLTRPRGDGIHMNVADTIDVSHSPLAGLTGQRLYLGGLNGTLRPHCGSRATVLAGVSWLVPRAPASDPHFVFLGRNIGLALLGRVSSPSCAALRGGEERGLSGDAFCRRGILEAITFKPRHGLKH
jgi:hypothetical protein